MKATVFVSSTFLDLSDIRDSVGDFLINQEYIVKII